MSDQIIDSVFNRLGGVRVTPIDPVRPWTETPEPPEEPMPIKPQDQFAREFTEVNQKGYVEQLLRPGGMMLNDPSRCDVEAMHQWGWQLASGKTVNEVLNQIVRSQEWADKHPGQTPPTFP